MNFCETPSLMERFQESESKRTLFPSLNYRWHFVTQIFILKF